MSKLIRKYKKEMLKMKIALKGLFIKHEYIKIINNENL